MLNASTYRKWTNNFDFTFRYDCNTKTTGFCGFGYWNMKLEATNQKPEKINEKIKKKK